uniref:Cadherin domain-containing protein n=1 Tax=Sinocyclocheilus rhinocerous TaxID=307959 RepID=A0A673G7G9_9TELE
MARQVLLFIWFLSLSSALGQVSYSIPEEMAKGSLVGNIAQDLGLDLKRLKSGKARIYTGDSAEYIELNKERGVLLIKERIDREALCGQTTPCALHLQIILDNPMELFRVTVEIADINDNSPIFKRDERRFEISESAVVGSKFMLEKAIDADIGANDLQSYLLQPTDHFNLKLHGQSDGSKKVEMILQKPLDREKQENMTLILTAVDGGEPPKSGTVQIHITVLDANDNAPVFTKPIYRAIITENSQSGTPLITVSASDSDKGTNGEVSYLIANSDGESDIFHIDENGLVTLVGKIDFEISKHYQIDIEAVDNGGLSDSSKIMVDVIDINDNAPVITVMSKSNAIPEDSPQSTVIAMISVNDPDSNSNGQVYCSANEKIPFTIKSTSNGFYSIVTDSDLDRERVSDYNISVTCADEGVPSLSSSVTLSLQISDVNDNAPVFDKSSYEASVQENNTPGLSIFTIRASDADFNQNTYRLDPNDHFVLKTLSHTDGTKYVEMVLQTPLDREKQEEYILILTAFDGGTPQKTGTVKINVIVLDANDNAPVFSQSVYTALVAENAPMGSLVLKISATDADQGTNKHMSYSFSQISKSILNSFSIESTNDNGGLTDTAKVMVEITDVNDNAPVINVISFSNPLPENSAPETVIAMLNVKDLDSGKNGQVRCLINPSLPFRIRQSSSNFYSLITDQLLDREKISEYNITITAIDEGSPSFTTNKTLILKLSDVNDNAPVFQLALSQVRVCVCFCSRAMSHNKSYLYYLRAGFPSPVS